ncbi:MAG TPA: hypothetical protein VF323_13555 [Candidatus Limnocylindrales bacterium]
MTAADPTVPEPTHACVRCGRPVVMTVGMCERCNPLGLADPAASQVHGTVFLAIAIGVVALAVLARLMLSGIGPFQATVSAVAPTTAGLNVTLSVTNQGSRAGSSTCRVHNGAALMNDDAAYFLSPQIEPGATATFTRETSALGSATVPGLIVECSTP